jgi:hypothetical protein
MSSILGKVSSKTGISRYIYNSLSTCADLSIKFRVMKCGIVQELKGFNKRRASQCKQPLDIAINTNPMLVQNMESEKLLDYTVMDGSGRILAPALKAPTRSIRPV